MTRKKIVAGNWKMNMTLEEGKSLIADLKNNLPNTLNNVEVIIAPPYILLDTAQSALQGSSIHIAGQDCHQESKGAYTGEISADMLKSVGARFVILGHSERRQYFGEREDLLAKKINAALTAGLKVIYCVGEDLTARESNKQNDIVAGQLEALYALTADQMQQIIVAYEPVWAIGTGKTATAAQAQEMHAFIRQTLAEKFGQDIADATSILYGGSCNPQNAAEIFAGADVDGGLIGGAALKAADFISIIEARSK